MTKVASAAKVDATTYHPHHTILPLSLSLLWPKEKGKVQKEVK